MEKQLRKTKMGKKLRKTKMVKRRKMERNQEKI